MSVYLQKTAFELHSKDMEELTGESRALRVELNDLKQASKQAKKTLQAKQKKHATSAAACKVKHKPPAASLGL